MSADKQPLADQQAPDDETTVSRAELAIERDKVEIERERLALERERLAAERERWRIDSELRSRAEGRGIRVSTLIYVAVICVLVGGIVGGLALGRRAPARTMPGFSLEKLMGAAAPTNAAERGGAPIVLRAVDANGTSRNAYLLLFE
jgi:hypothetical protein